VRLVTAENPDKKKAGISLFLFSAKPGKNLDVRTRAKEPHSYLHWAVFTNERKRSYQELKKSGEESISRSAPHFENMLGIASRLPLQFLIS